MQLKENQLKWLRKRIKTFAEQEKRSKVCRAYIATQRLELRVKHGNEKILVA